jgi:hypothetical protein
MPSSIEALSLQPADEFPEGGYGWVCVVSIFLINAHTWGINGVCHFQKCLLKGFLRL